MPRVHLWLVMLVAAALLSACAPPATLKSRADYWADQSDQASAYNHRVRFLVLHYTSDDGARALKVLTGTRVSVHYLVPARPRLRDSQPIVRQLVPEDERAWHAGMSAWAGRHHINDSSIGVEIVNRGPLQIADHLEWQPYSNAQIRALIALCRDIIHRYDIAPQNVVGHSDIAPTRKIDPGPAFPWHRLYEAGIGAWPQPERVAYHRQRFERARPSIAAIQAALDRYGYDVPISGAMTPRTHDALSAFQMHFRPSDYSGTADTDTMARLWALDERYRRR